MAKSGNIQCHYDSSKNVQDISTVFVRFRYESMTIHDGNATVNHGLTTVAQRMLTVLVRFDTVLVRFTAVAVVANRGAP